jgi:ketosteroid isomerase-like protein
VNSADILRQWLTAINSYDVTALAALMAADFAFVDSLGNRVDGAKSMETGWRSYFAMCPDYWIRADHVMAEGDILLVAGEAGGTIGGESWRLGRP